MLLSLMFQLARDHLRGTETCEQGMVSHPLPAWQALSHLPQNRPTEGKGHAAIVGATGAHDWAEWAWRSCLRPFLSKPAALAGTGQFPDTHRAATNLRW
jgi:hypothetical protein